ncbi:MAG: hypothetical protein KF773_35550 [Deltaproteobacteria bacterium]|nr:hypothetical protein [Deltaproteobacteria bacterium]
MSWMRDYEGLRDALVPSLREARDEVLDERLDLEVAESLDAFGRAMNGAGQAARRAAPGATQGAITGFQVAGPWGALIGAGAGAALGSKQPGAPAIPAVGNVNPAAPGAPAAVPAAGNVNPAALQLLAVLMRPEVIQALQALALGSAGTPTVPVGNVAVPAAAFPNLIQSLAEAAMVHHHANGRLARSPAWSRHVETFAVENIADPTARSVALLSLLAQCEPEDRDAELDEDDEDGEDDNEDEEPDESDLIDLADLARLGGA